MNLRCDVCRIGRLETDYIPYIHMIGGQIMVIPNVPSLVCDTCQHTQHDPSFLDHVGKLVDETLSEDDVCEKDLEREQLILRSSIQHTQSRRIN